MTKEQYLELHAKLCEQMKQITAAKNADYAGEGDPFANFKLVGHLGEPKWIEQGFITRMSDKLSRIANYVRKGNLQVKSESVQDTLLDLANYSLLMIGYLESLKSNAAAPSPTERAQAATVQNVGGKHV